MSSIHETLAEEAAAAEAAQSENPAKMQRARKTTSTTSQVYTVRMPADRLAELRTVAEEAGEQPSALMRRWVLERLDSERGHEPDLAEIRRHLGDALQGLDRLRGKDTA